MCQQNTETEMYIRDEDLHLMYQLLWYTDHILHIVDKQLLFFLDCDPK